MSDSNHHHDVDSRTRAPSRWRGSASMTIQLVVVAVIAIVAGLLLFPL